MGDNEFLRQKREREFHQRVLAAVEKPKQARIWAALNSRLFSVLVLGTFAAAFGGYFTQHQQCVREGNQTAELFGRLGTELSQRRYAIYQAVDKAKSIDDVRNAVHDTPWAYSELRDKSLFQLDRDFENILHRIEGDFLRVEELRISGGFAYPEAKFMGLWDGTLRTGATTADLPVIKRFARMSAIDWIRKVSLAQNSTIEPRCSPIDVAVAALGSGTIRLTSHIWRIYWDLDFARATAYSIPGKGVPDELLSDGEQ